MTLFNEIKPPWVLRPSEFPGDDASYWGRSEGQHWLKDIFLPFYDALSLEDQSVYCDKWRAPTSWITLFLHPEIDEEMADIDEADTGTRVEPLNFRQVFGVA